MSNGFDALMTDIKARIGALIGTMRSKNAVQADSATARATDIAEDRPRHPRGSFRESVGRPTENERVGAASTSKRMQDRGD